MLYYFFLCSTEMLPPKWGVFIRKADHAHQLRAATPPPGIYFLEKSQPTELFVPVNEGSARLPPPLRKGR